MPIQSTVMKKESLHNMNCFELLGIEPTKDKKTIRHAYASQAKKYNLETDTKQIERLKDAYDNAMAYARESADTVDIAENVSEENVIKDRDIGRYIAEENAIPELPLEDIMVSLKEEDKPVGEIFYESESLWENYGKAQYDKAKELPGIRKIEKGIGEGHIFTFEEGRKYVMSPEFLNNQYEEFYIHILVELFEKYKKSLEKFFIPVAFMYGWENGGSNDERFLQSLLGQKENDFIESLLKRAEVMAFYVNAQRYYSLTKAYKDNDKDKQGFFWSGLWQYGLNHDVLPVVKVKNDFSFWSMLTVFLESHSDLDLNAYIELERWFNLSSEKNSSKKHIFQPIVDRIEENTGYSMDIIKLMAANGQQITELRKKAQLSSYLKEGRLSYSAFAHLYELYYFVPEPSEEEQKVMEVLQEYTEFVEFFWKQAEQEFKED